MSFGFIITRHVNSPLTNNYWNTCIICIRALYPNKKIVVIDDDSNKEFVKAHYEYKNVEIIESEFPRRGELLPYYYFHKYKFFENAVIIHDSVFFHKRINFEKLSGLKALPLWHFSPDKENYMNSLRIVSSLKSNYDIQKKITMNDINILGFTQKEWYGCFGVQSYINYHFLQHLERKYSIFNMLKMVSCRRDRCGLERIFGILFFTECKKLENIKSLFGNIHHYNLWGYKYEEYQKDLSLKKLPKSVIKVWTGR